MENNRAQEYMNVSILIEQLSLNNEQPTVFVTANEWLYYVQQWIAVCQIAGNRGIARDEDYYYFGKITLSLTLNSLDCCWIFFQEAFETMKTANFFHLFHGFWCCSGQSLFFHLRTTILHFKFLLNVFKECVCSRRMPIGEYSSQYFHRSALLLLSRCVS